MEGKHTGNCFARNLTLVRQGRHSNMKNGGWRQKASLIYASGYGRIREENRAVRVSRHWSYTKGLRPTVLPAQCLITGDVLLAVPVLQSPLQRHAKRLHFRRNPPF